MVANEMMGNISRPPYRSVRAPTGIRPRAPTITGTATIRACWKLVSPSVCLKCAPSGDSSAQAQNVSANPTVAMPSMTYGRRPTVASPAVPGRLTIVAMAYLPWIGGRRLTHAARPYRIPPRTGETVGANDLTGLPLDPRRYLATMPASCASSPAWVRLSRPSLSGIRDTYPLTVASDRYSRPAIWAL